ncbi:MAG: hypothetical protein ABI359_02080, partial [Ginsengibacter sp.]
MNSYLILKDICVVKYGIHVNAFPIVLHASPSFIHKKVTNYMNLNSDVGWWSLLAKKDQLEMAILLCKNA